MARRRWLSRGAPTRGAAEVAERELGGGTVDSIVGLGLQSGHIWEGEDLVAALRRRAEQTSPRSWRGS
ncbi:hypothetical protein [Infirmifilum sp. NZ]|uniref:hypothetical protein n=1 Tax=Infirmifilum sp. NZ TaxID=2926850 RepID=UPI00279FAE7F|nr:hypothetical protein [Infirmifilum sp. NZ]UNQ73749.1 hypothetical protein MOV14_01740 [Infirmifilum sp. NZ]